MGHLVPTWAKPLLEAYWTVRASRAQLSALKDSDFRRFARSADVVVFGALIALSLLALLFPPVLRLLVVVAAASLGLAYIRNVGRFLLAERRRRGRRHNPSR